MIKTRFVIMMCLGLNLLATGPTYADEALKDYGQLLGHWRSKEAPFIGGTFIADLEFSGKDKCSMKTTMIEDGKPTVIGPIDSYCAIEGDNITISMFSKEIADALGDEGKTRYRVMSFGKGNMTLKQKEGDIHYTQVQ